MKRTKIFSKIFITTALLALLVVLSVSFIACGATMHAVTWDKGDSTITVDGYDVVPAQIAEGTEVKFKVTPNTGYFIDSVKIITDGSETVIKAEADGKYAFTTFAATKIKVNTLELAGKLEVYSEPTLLTYFSGQRVDTTGMVIAAEYVVGGVEVLDLASPEIKIAPEVFKGGETEFSVTYRGTTEVIQLVAAVEHLVTFDSFGGTFSADAIAVYSQFNNYKLEDGVLQFSYFENLDADGLALPALDEVTKAGYRFFGWNTDLEVIKNNNGSMKFKAEWEDVFVIVDSIEFENVQTGDDLISQLVIKGKFNTAEEITLLLYEGNDEVYYIGDSFSGSVGSSFTFRFDLKEFVEDKPEYLTKWMDIRFVTDFVEEDIEAGNLGQQIHVDDDSLNVDTASRVQSNGYVYSFAVYENKTWGKTLKVYFDVVFYNYTTELNEQDLTLTIKGTFYDEKYIGKTVKISWFQSSESEGDTCIIGEDGTWEIEIDLKDFALKSNAFAHITVLDGNDEIFGNKNTNLVIAASFTNFPKLEKKVGDITNALRIEDEDGVAYYIGYAWDGLMVYVRNENLDYEFEAAALKDINGKANIVLSGTWAGVAEGFEDLVADVQLFDEWTTTDLKLVVDAKEDGTFTISLDISEVKTAGLYVIHFGGGDLTYELDYQTEPITIDGLTYKYMGKFVAQSKEGWEADWNVLGFKISPAV